MNARSPTAGDDCPRPPHAQPRRPPLPPAGFTLLELLLVIALLALLSSLLLPAVARARSLVLATACGQQLRQWGLATTLYAEEHEGLLPPEGFPNPTDRHTNSGWYVQLPRQLGLRRYHEEPWRTNPAVLSRPSTWLCPANPRRSNGRNLFHYCLNLHVDGTSDEERRVLLASLNDPARTVWLFDTKNLPAVGSANFVHTNLHSGGAQVLFLDTHVARFRAAAFRDERTGRPRTDHPALLWEP